MEIHVNGTTLYVDVEGARLRPQGSDLVAYPTVVVLHGGPGFDQGYLRPGLAPLADVAQLVFLDLRGQGRSSRVPVETCTLEQMAEDVEAVCAQLGLGKVAVLGHSAGGFVALELATRHPTRLTRLVLCDTAPTLAPVPDEDPPPGLADRSSPEAVAAAERLFGGDFSQESVDAFGQLVAPFYAGPDHENLPQQLMALSSLNGEVAAHFFGQLAASYDLRPRLSEITVPALVVVGAWDWVCPPAQSKVMAAGIPNADLLVVDGAGHFPFSERPQEFLARVGPFLSGD
jgi:proline iminopeptidase